MTNKFTTPCFVRVEDAEKREELIDWCASIGYNTNGWRLPQKVCYIFVCGDFAGRSGELALTSLPADAIDCGTDVELFKALAAMNDENDREQWFCDDNGLWEKCDNDLPTRYMQMNGHKVTAEELINHFKSK